MLNGTPVVTPDGTTPASRSGGDDEAGSMVNEQGPRRPVRSPLATWKVRTEIPGGPEGVPLTTPFTSVSPAGKVPFTTENR